MNSMLYLDTHVVVWLYANDRERLKPAVLRRIEREDLLVSPVVRLELAFLNESSRIQADGDTIIDDLAERLGLSECDFPFPIVASHAAVQTWTRDPFDRLITGHAAAREKQLLTRDQHILENFAGAIWPKG